MLRLLRRSLLLAVVVLTAGLKLPAPGAAGAVGRRAAICLLPACLLAPQLAEAKYRPSLSEMKGYGSSPVVDKMNEEKQVATTLSFAQLVANSKSSQEKMMGRSLSDEEMTELQAHLAPKPATAITAATAAAAAAAAVHETSQVGGQVGTVVDSHRVEPDGLVLGSGLGSRFRFGFGFGFGFG